MVELADTLDLGSSAQACRFDPCQEHQRQVAAPKNRVAASIDRTSPHKGAGRAGLISGMDSEKPNFTPRGWSFVFGGKHIGGQSRFNIGYG